MKKKSINKKNKKNNINKKTIESDKISLEKSKSRSKKKRTIKKWLTVLLLCLMCTIIQSMFFCLLYPLVIKTEKNFRFFPDFRKGNIFYCFLAVIFITATIFLFGIFASLSQAFETNFRPLHSFSGWLIAAILVCSFSLLILFALNGSLEQYINPGIYSAMLKYKEDTEMRSIMNMIQMENQCCGIHNFTDWFEIDFMETVSKYQVGFPSSCCDIHNHQQCIHSVPFLIDGKLTPWKIGCSNILKKLIGKIIFLCYISLGFVVVGGVVVLFFVVSLKEKEEVDESYAREKEIELAKKFRREKEERIEKKIFKEMVAERTKKKKMKKGRSLLGNESSTKNNIQELTIDEENFEEL